MDNGYHDSGGIRPIEPLYKYKELAAFVLITEMKKLIPTMLTPLTSSSFWVIRLGPHLDPLQGLKSVFFARTIILYYIQRLGTVCLIVYTTLFEE